MDTRVETNATYYQWMLRHQADRHKCHIARIIQRLCTIYGVPMDTMQAEIAELIATLVAEIAQD